MSAPDSPRFGARQLRFIDEYMIDCNATRAAIDAGYSKRTASQAGFEVLRNPKVAAELSRRQRLLAERHEVTIDNVISELSKIGFASAADFYAVDEAGRLMIDVFALADPKKAAAISQIEVTETKDGQVIKLKMADKRAALGDLSRHLGLGPDRLEVTVSSALAPSAEPNIRDLALAALALVNEAVHEREREKSKPLLLNGSTPERRVGAERSVEENVPRQTNAIHDDDDPFDLDDP